MTEDPLRAAAQAAQKPHAVVGTCPICGKVTPRRQLALALRWILIGARSRKGRLADRDELGARRDVATAADDYMRWGSGELGGADEGLPYHQALSEALQRLKKATEPTSTPPKKEPSGEL